MPSQELPTPPENSRPQLYVLKNDQPLGPFTDSDVVYQLRTAAFVHTDLCCREGAQEWRPLSELYGAPPATTDAVVPTSPVKALHFKNKSRWALVIIGLLTLAIGGYILSPYIAIRSLIAAVQNADARSIKNYVDFPQLRSSIKEEIKAKFISEVRGGSEGLVGDATAAIGLFFGSSMVDAVVDQVLTPTNVAGFLSDPSATLGDAAKKGESPIGNVEFITDFDEFHVRHEFFSGLTTFDVSTNAGIDFHFRFVDLGWKLTAITLPDRAEQAELETAYKAKRRAKIAERLNSGGLIGFWKEDRDSVRDESEGDPELKLPNVLLSVNPDKSLSLFIFRSSVRDAEFKIINNVSLHIDTPSGDVLEYEVTDLETDSLTLSPPEGSDSRAISLTRSTEQEFHDIKRKLRWRHFGFDLRQLANWARLLALKDDSQVLPTAASYKEEILTYLISKADMMDADLVALLANFDVIKYDKDSLRAEPPVVVFISKEDAPDPSLKGVRFFVTSDGKSNCLPEHDPKLRDLRFPNGSNEVVPDGLPSKAAMVRNLVSPDSREGKFAEAFLLASFSPESASDADKRVNPQSVDDSQAKKPQAKDLMEEAAEQGLEEAQVVLAMWLAAGEYGVTKNPEASFRWYLKAAEQGNPLAQAALGDAFYQGLDAEKNEEEAIKWLTKAAEQGNPNAQFSLGAAYYEGAGGVRVDKAESVKWLQLAADQDSAGAQMSLALAYLEGAGLPQNEAKALELLEKSARGGNYSAAVKLGLHYLDKWNEQSPTLTNATKCYMWFTIADSLAPDGSGGSRFGESREMITIGGFLLGVGFNIESFEEEIQRSVDSARRSQLLYILKPYHDLFDRLFQRIRRPEKPTSA
jgi:TPR repeat protein